MVKLKLAAQFKQALQGVNKFTTHPCQEYEEDDKLNYLKALSLMIYADESRSEEEASYFGSVFRTLNPENITLERIFEFAQNPDLKEVDAISTTLKKDDEIGISFLMDMVMLAFVDGAVSDEEKHLLAVGRLFLGWDHTIYHRCYCYCTAIAASHEGNEEFYKYLTVFPEKSTAHILEYKGLAPRENVDSQTEWIRENLRSQSIEQLPAPEEFPSISALPDGTIAHKVKKALEAVMVFESHPMADASLEDKMNYLKALSLVMAADEKIVLEEQVYFGAVTRTLVGSDMVQSLMTYAEAPDLTEIDAMIETMAKSEDYKSSLILDAVVLAFADGEFHSDEHEFIAQFRELVGWTHAEFNAAVNLSNAIMQAPEGDVLNSLLVDLAHGLAQAAHVLVYRGVVGSAVRPTASELGIDFEGIGTFSSGRIDNGNMICKQPITVKQIYPFLAYWCFVEDVEVIDGQLQLRSGIELVKCEQNKLELIGSVLVLKLGSDEDLSLPGFSPYVAQKFAAWLSQEEGYCYELPLVVGDSREYVSWKSLWRNALVKHGKKIRYIKNCSYCTIIVNQEVLNENKICDEAKLFIVRSQS